MYYSLQTCTPYIPRVVPAECMTYFKPHVSIIRWMSATWSETEGEEVPTWHYVRRM